MKKVGYKGWRNCIRLANREIELIVTTDVGPRVIRLGFVGGRNLFYEAAEQAGKRGGNKWRAYGGHRFWHAPEAAPRSYAPDNEPVPYSWDGRTLRLAQKVEALTGIEKELEITLNARRNHVRVLHRLVNRNLWPVEAACWGLSVMAAGGRAIFPQEAYGPHPKFMLPARPMVLWPYTDMADRRFTWGTKYVQFRQDANAARPNKIGLRNTLGWAAYALEGEVFVKRFPFDAGAKYVDFGCNNEAFANAEMLEVESLGGLVKMAPGAKAEHVEDWYLFKAEVPESEAGITRVLGPLVGKAGR